MRETLGNQKKEIKRKSLFWSSTGTLKRQELVLTTFFREEKKNVTNKLEYADVECNDIFVAKKK